MAEDSELPSYLLTTDRTPSDFLNELLADRKRLGA
jgi:hypothetical protein